MADEFAFTRRELQRVGAAVLLMAVLGTIIIIGMTIAMGHYNTLAHAGPKAVIDGVAVPFNAYASRRLAENAAALSGERHFRERLSSRADATSPARFGEPPVGARARLDN